MVTQTTDDLLVERGKTHGEYSEHARCTQAIMDAIQRERNWSSLPPEIREALHMIAHKIGRVATGDPYVADHFDDIAGYARLVSQRIEKMRARQKQDDLAKIIERELDTHGLSSAQAQMKRDVVAEHEKDDLRVLRVGDPVYVRGIREQGRIVDVRISEQPYFVEWPDGKYPSNWFRFDEVTYARHASPLPPK